MSAVDNGGVAGCANAAFLNTLAEIHRTEDFTAGWDANGSTVLTCATCELPVCEAELAAHPCFAPPADDAEAA